MFIAASTAPSASPYSPIATKNTGHDGAAPIPATAAAARSSPPTTTVRAPRRAATTPESALPSPASTHTPSTTSVTTSSPMPSRSLYPGMLVSTTANPNPCTAYAAVVAMRALVTRAD
ncbi:hypothetical protein [Cellulosimicrobium composti]|uniref:hypothetical protein n=1 Tax=Cellulosimicrobium composti TaxID=2672572 RepID=UPI0037AA3028